MKKVTKYIFICWALLCLLITSAYAGFTSTLSIDAKAVVEGHIYDYVYISKMSIVDASGGVSYNYSFLDHDMSCNIKNTSCNSYVTYQITITNTTNYKAFITNHGINTSLSSSDAITNYSVEFIDVVDNVTYIEPHSTKLVNVKIMNNCTNTVNDVLKIDTFFEYSLYKKHALTINSTPNTSTITLSTTEGTFTGTGTLTKDVAENETISYTVSNDEYYSNSGTYTMGTVDDTISVTLTPYVRKSLTITCNISTAVITIKDGDTTIASGVGSVTTSPIVGNSITYEVSEPDYYYVYEDNTYKDASITITMPDSDTSYSVTLTEKPWQLGMYTNTEETEATTGSISIYHTGYYLIELWGGIGGQDYQKKSTVGAAGYIYAMVYLNSGETLYYTLGGDGFIGKLVGTAKGGANGGVSANDIYAGSSAGYSAVMLNTSTIDESTVNSGNVLMIAGGGGGCAAGNLPTRQDSYGSGGAGGSMSSTTTTTSIGIVYHGGNGGWYKSATRMGYGGTTTGGAPGKNGEYGSFLQGGKAADGQDGADTVGGPGGGGYYGGGGGGGKGTPSDGGGGGGGGSSLISTVLGRCIAGNTSSLSLGTNTSSTGGAINFRWIGKTL